MRSRFWSVHQLILEEEDTNLEIYGLYPKATKHEQIYYGDFDNRNVKLLNLETKKVSKVYTADSFWKVVNIVEINEYILMIVEWNGGMMDSKFLMELISFINFNS